MKRSRARADPVSCQSCRSRKLRCNRVQPCSNCAARHITCEFSAGSKVQHDKTPESTHGTSKPLARVERLESLARLGRTSNATIFPAPPEPLYDSSDGPQDRVQQARELDLEFLESIEARENTQASRFSKDLIFNISSTQHILDTQNNPWKAAPLAEHGKKDSIRVTFPIYTTAVLLFENYESSVDHVCRVLHNPSVKSLMKILYLHISQKEAILPSDAALLLSLFSLSVFFYQPSESSEVVTSNSDAHNLSTYWSKCAHDMLDYSRRNTPSTLEDVQTCILMSYVTHHLDGFSAQGRHLSMLAASLARDLRLHRLDDNDGISQDSHTNVRTLIDREVKRRVFWHIASTDWLQSTISGPQEGMYFIHPNHTNIRVPRECDDDEVVQRDYNGSTYGSEPTSMTFFIARVQLAHICREWCDVVSMAPLDITSVSYDVIINIDTKLKAFLDGLPFLFSLDSASRERSRYLEVVYPKIPIMRYCIATAAHSRRCRLHQKFLIHQSTNLRYSFSREACLESARAVIQAFHDACGNTDTSFTAAARMEMAIHYTYLTLVVMTMDLCFNKDQANEDDVRRVVAGGLQLFESIKHLSPLARPAIETIWKILRKHQIDHLDLLGLAIDHDTRSNRETLPASANLQRDILDHHPDFGVDFPDQPFICNNPFDDNFWQISAQENADFDMGTWDQLFTLVDSRPI